jgi:hypothetical protein
MGLSAREIVRCYLRVDTNSFFQDGECFGMADLSKAVVAISALQRKMNPAVLARTIPSRWKLQLT